MRRCHCTPPLILRYLARISGPLLDRIDLHMQVPAVKYRELTQQEMSEDAAAIRDRILAARRVQNQRPARFGIHSNAQLTPRTLRRFCKFHAASDKQLETAVARRGLSARAYNRVLRVSRTIADLEAKETIEAAHVAEAIQYRTLDCT
jgi:magnesium chelatase family protein